MKSKFLIFLSFCIFTSCDLGFNSNLSSIKQNENKDSKNQLVKCYISLSGAIPEEVIPSGTDNNIAKSALPVFSSEEYYYFVEAKKSGSSEQVLYGAEDSSKFLLSSSGTVSFELPLSAGKWEITSGVKNASSNETVLSQTLPQTISESETVADLNFLVTPTKTGEGDIALEFYLSEIGSDEISHVKVDCHDAAWKSAVTAEGTAYSPLNLDYDSGFGGDFKLNIDSIASGSYEVSFSFLNSDEVVLFHTIQTVNVIAGMTTKNWVAGSDLDDSVITGGKFTITRDALKRFVRRVFYVEEDAEEDGDGSPYKPLNSLQKAFDIIDYCESAHPEDYKIFVKGRIIGKNKIPSAITTSKANSITISGITGNTVDILDGNNSGSVLTIESVVPVTIRNLKITGGKATSNDGGGINVSAENAELTLAQGCLVMENKAPSKNGGGIYINGSRLVLKDDAKVCKNEAYSEGGGISIHSTDSYAASLEMKGTSSVEDCKTTRSGGWWGGGILASGKESKRCSITLSGSASIKACSAKEGGGIGLIDFVDLDLKGNVEISGNSASSDGAGIRIWNSTASLSGGIIKNNKATSNGGAFSIKNKGILNLSGSAYIPYGVEGTTGKGKNDVYFSGGDDAGKIVVNGSFIPRESSSEKIATIEPPSWTRGISVINADETNVKDVTLYKKYFALMQNDWELKISDDKKSLLLDSPIYVSKDGSASAAGTKNNPRNTIENACKLLNDKNTDYTILVSGTITGVQQIPASLKKDGSGTYNAKSVTLSGVSGNTTDILNGGFTRDSNGTTLKILTDVPVKIKKLKITGGYASQSSAGGGGLYAKGDVTLSQGALVSGNYTASSGGGIYNDSKILTVEDGVEISGNYEKGVSNCGGGAIFNHGGTLIISGGVIKSNTADHDGGAIYNDGEGSCYIYGNTLIGKEVTAAPGEWYNGSNKAENGGAICVNGGNVYIGYKKNSGTAQQDSEASVKVMGNAVKSSSSKGGGIYVAAGSLQIAKTCVAYNYSPKDGGGIYTTGVVRLLEDAVIKGNSAFSYGGGVHINKKGSLSMTSNSIIGGSETGDANKAASGGGVYVASNSSTTGDEATVTFGTSGASATPSISGNSATSGGGGVYVENFAATFNMNSGTISNNKVVGGTTGGGGVEISYGTFNMNGGIISGNYIETPGTSTLGGAVDINTNGKFTIKGTVSIPYGGEKYLNDVSARGNPIKITGAITLPEGVSSVATIIPKNYTDTILELETSPNPPTILANEAGKFRIVPNPSETPLGTGLERGLDNSGKYSDFSVVVAVGENNVNDVRASINTLINDSTDAISLCFTDNYEPVLSNSEYMFTIPENKNVTLKAASSVTFTFGSNSNRYNNMFVLQNNATLTIGENIILDGGHDNSSKVRKCALLNSGSELILDGAQITKFHYDGGGEMFTVKSGSILRIKGSTKIYNNKSQLIVKGGTVYMEGGEICNNDLYNIDNAVIIIQDEGKFIKSGGRIYNNKGYRNGRVSKPSQVKFYGWYGGGYWGTSVDNLTAYNVGNRGTTNDSYFDNESDIP